MRLIPYRSIALLENRDFFLLSLIMFLFQASTAFILLGLIVSVFMTTGSNFGVSGVIVSFSLPGFLVFVFAGLVSDLFDRRKIILLANFLEVLVVFLILLTINTVYASIVFSFVYFMLNALFLPAASAAVSQIVGKGELLAANSMFIFTLVGGQLLGLIVAALVHFFFGNVWTLLVCAAVTIVTAFLCLFLPPLMPRVREKISLFSKLVEIFSVFKTLLSKKTVWFYFVVLAFMQGLIAFGITLGPGFFDEVIGIGVSRSPIFILPMILFGVVLGIFIVHIPNIKEQYLVLLGQGMVGLASLILGFSLKFEVVSGRYVLIPTAVFLTALGFGVIVTIIASRAVIQDKVAHIAQGTIFGALMVLASFFAGVMSPLAAALEAIFGYVNILVYGGIGFCIFAILIAKAGQKWKF